MQTYLDALIRSQQQPHALAQQYYPIYLEALLAQVSLMCQSLNPSLAAGNAPQIIKDILDYLNGHLTQELSLDDISGRFFISKYYMNRAFKKATGTTVMDYVRYKRVVLARQLIRSGETAQDAAVKCGFGDYSVFYRAYKKIWGVGPAWDKREDSQA